MSSFFAFFVWEAETPFFQLSVASPNNVHMSTLLRKSILILLAGFMPAVIIQAQDPKVIRDLRLWTGVRLEKDFAGDWRFTLSAESRFRHNMSEVASYFSEAGIRYRITKNFALSADYRITNDRKRDDTYRILTRYNLDLRYKGDLDMVSVRYRLRYQKEVPEWNLFSSYQPYEKFVRHRLQIRYEELGKTEPFVLAEVFQIFEPGLPSGLSHIRIQAGTMLKAGSFGELKMSAGFNRELATANPAIIYVFTARYTFSL